MGLSVLKEAAMTFTALARSYLMDRASDGQAVRTGASYDESFALFVVFLRQRGARDDIREFTPEAVAGFKAWLFERGLKASSVGSRLSALASLGKWGTLVERPVASRLTENPVLRVSRPKRQRPQEKYLYREELRALQAVQCEPNERLVLDAFLDTAARVTEIATAKVRGLRPEGDHIVLTNVVKGGRVASWPLGPELSSRLEASLRQREVRPDDPVFVNQGGRTYTRTALSELVQRLALRAGIMRIPVRCHVLRHTVNVVADEIGISATDRALGILKHSDTSTVAKYNHMRPGREIEARAKVREALRG